jgi:ribosomal protein L22
MSDEENNEATEPEAAEPAAEAPAGASASAEDSAPSAQEEAAPETEEVKPARKPRARKPKAEAEATAEPKADEPVAEEAVAETADDLEAEAATDEVVEAEDEVVAATEKPKRSRAAKPKAETAKAGAKAPASRQPEPKRAARRGHQEPVAAPVVRAQAKYVRSSARKARLVCDNIRGKSVEDARAILAHTPRAVARDWSKLLESAVANAEHNHELVGEDLFIKAVTADEGPTIKRFRPRAMGRATKIRKRTSHLTILLTPKN